MRSGQHSLAWQRHHERYCPGYCAGARGRRGYTAVACPGSSSCQGYAAGEGKAAVSFPPRQRLSIHLQAAREREQRCRALPSSKDGAAHGSAGRGGASRGEPAFAFPVRPSLSPPAAAAAAAAALFSSPRDCRHCVTLVASLRRLVRPNADPWLPGSKSLGCLSGF